MKKLYFLLLAAIISSPAFAHEGHGIDAGSVWHFFSAPHVLLPIGIVLLIAGLRFIINAYRNQR